METGAAGAGRLFVDSFFFSFLSFSGGRVGAGQRGCAGGSCAASKGLLFDLSSLKSEAFGDAFPGDILPERRWFLYSSNFLWEKGNVMLLFTFAFGSKLLNNFF